MISWLIELRFGRQRYDSQRPRNGTYTNEGGRGPISPSRTGVLTEGLDAGNGSGNGSRFGGANTGGPGASKPAGIRDGVSVGTSPGTGREPISS